MASSDGSSPKTNPKKANLVDHHSIKHLLDESVSEIVTGRGYTEDVRLSNIRLLLGTIIIAIALVAQFYPKKFPENRDFLVGCIVLYIVFNGLLQLIIYTKEKNAILFTYPLPLESAVFHLGNVGSNSHLSRPYILWALLWMGDDAKAILSDNPCKWTGKRGKTDKRLYSVVWLPLVGWM